MTACKTGLKSHFMTKKKLVKYNEKKYFLCKYKLFFLYKYKLFFLRPLTGLYKIHLRRSFRTTIKSAL